MKLLHSRKRTAQRLSRVLRHSLFSPWWARSPAPTEHHFFSVAASATFCFRIGPLTILNSKSRHSRGPLKRGVRRLAARPISLGRRRSAVKRYAHQPAKFRLRLSPSRG